MTTILDTVIVGAGAAGLTAAFDLSNRGLSFRTLEASDRVGGRVRRITSDFGQDTANGTGFPIDIGGEWVHGEQSLLDEIAQQPINGTFDGIFEVIDWRPWSYRYNENNADMPWTYYRWWGVDHKFVNTTWYNFFESYIMTTDVMDSVVYGCQVTKIDYSVDQLVTLDCNDGRSFQAQQAILTVPVPILQEDITFIPDLPNDYQEAVDDLDMLPGLKVVLQFATKFYYDSFTIEPYNYYQESGRYFYNPYYGQDDTTTANIMTIDIVGDFARRYIHLTDAAIVYIMLKDLDRVFSTAADNRVATNNLLDSFVQHWSVQPYTRGVYSGSNWRSIEILREPLESKLIFAGEAIPYDGCNFDWGYVHGAARSGRAAASMIY